MKIETFLILDSDKDYLNDLKNLLNYMNYYHIDHAKTAEQAMTLIRNRKYSLVVSASELTDMTGLTFLQLLKKEMGGNAPAVFISCDDFTPIDIIRLGIAGADGFLEKPYDLENIVQSIEAVSIESETELHLKEMYQKGLRYIHETQYEKAIDHFNAFLACIPMPEFYYNDGIIHTIQGGWEKAASGFRHAATVISFKTKSLKALGSSFKKIGDTQRSKSCYEESTRIRLQNTFELDEALMEELIDINAKTMNVYNSMGVILRRKRKLKESLANYVIALKLNPEEPHVYYNVGRLYVELNRHEKALEYFQKSVRLNPGFQEGAAAIKAITAGHPDAYFKNLTTHS